MTQGLSSRNHFDPIAQLDQSGAFLKRRPQVRDLLGSPECRGGNGLLRRLTQAAACCAASREAEQRVGTGSFVG